MYWAEQNSTFMNIEFGITVYLSFPPNRVLTPLICVCVVTIDFYASGWFIYVIYHLQPSRALRALCQPKSSVGHSSWVRL